MHFNPRSIHLLLAMPPRFSGRLFYWLAAAIILGGCAASAPRLPYPAFIQTDELDDVFLAGLPGSRAKQLAGDAQRRTTSNRVELPAAWKGTSGGSPGKSLEIFVLDGKLSLADIDLGAGGYAYLPSGSLGFNLRSDDGARILYFVDDEDPLAVIRAPIIIDSNLLDWTGTERDGVAVRELRDDPGSGARTWMLQIAPGASLPWESSTALREGFLVTGDYQHSECVMGEAHTWQYAPGGYFLRPGGTVNGGPEARAATSSVWLLREKIASKTTIHDTCNGSP